MDGSPTADYLSFLLFSSHIPPVTVLSFFFLGLFRIAPIVAFAPFLGSKLPQGVKIGLAISLVLLLLPQIISTAKEPVAFNMTFVGLSLKELFIGFIISFFVTIPFYIAQSSGVLIDFLRGSSALMVPDPTMQTQISSIGLLYNYMLIVLFFYIGGLFYFFDGLLLSFSYLPVDTYLKGIFFASGFPFWKEVIALSTKILALSIQFAAPPLVAVLMAEMFLGIANRLAPQVQIAFLGMSIKSLLACALLFAAWMFILQQLGKFSVKWLTDMQRLFFLFS
ncbi:MAG: hypothetical protein A2Y28_04150 [Chlamydiae bacterium GWC2_50_10]|nr:MAG: hypothetical protein A2Z85_01460 [Chlamydiae bacterium GWA2_50_15]OGN54741.1 MAG: hypothetical protein A2Y28_04150 [Chlamydiae bacterium GWC2_50_10]OGN57493.1 MAG: hypothetical protein A3D18_04260 [Chlamydiae bacterium RIFCSPHIGHO2_02_FULL_49_29]OGN71100.1 MAG: hypothetical protein A3I15_05500 [Chlamydiae bacterium RIFCSPLOWO2_02_FULL_49_12]OGN73375.1 MAG: hypothetical protein A3G30_02725 [Chlamydiae bacterium RIFCSPLOWO2_12_FULL_49_12]HAZ15993.1 type III secretion protein [Parachlamyd